MIQLGGNEFIEPIRLTAHFDCDFDLRLRIEHRDFGTLVDPKIKTIGQLIEEICEPFRSTLHADAVGETRVLIEHRDVGPVADVTIDEIFNIGRRVVAWIEAQRRSGSQPLHAH